MDLEKSQIGVKHVGDVKTSGGASWPMVYLVARPDLVECDAEVGSCAKLVLDF